MVITEPEEIKVEFTSDKDNFKLNREHIIKRLQDAIEKEDYKTVDDIYEAYSFTKDKKLIELIKFTKNSRNYKKYEAKIYKNNLVKMKEQQYINKYGELKKYYDGTPVAIYNYLKRRTNDPDSLEMQGCTSVIKTEYGYRTRCNYRGKNSFGALILETKNFLIIHNKVIEVK